MFIVTNRDVDESRTDLQAFGTKLNRNGPNELRLAEATRAGRGWRIKVLPDTITAAMAQEVGLKHEIDPATGAPKPIFASRYVARKILARVNPALVGSRAAGRNLLFFVHGFNNDVKAVLERAEALERTYGVEVLPFSWPANGGGVHGVVSYKSDKRDALASTGALDRAFGRLQEYLQEINREYVEHMRREADRRFPDNAEQWDRFFTTQSQRVCPFTVNLMLHSMGNYLFKHLLGSSIYRGTALLFDNVVIVAADANNEDHAEWVNRIECRGRVFITINERDAALLASRVKMGEQQKARLGHYPYNLTAQRAVYVDFTDAPHVRDSHAYFEGDALKNKKVLKFFNEAFNGAPAESALSYDVARNLYRLA